MRRALVVAAMACAACGGGARLAKGPNARPIPDATMHAICTSDFGGDAARVQVWRQKDGTLVVLELLPDRAKRPDAPTTFFDEGGRETLRVSKPAGGPSSPEALDAERKREDVTLDGRKAEVLPCARK